MALPELVGAAEAAEILEISSTNLAHHRSKLRAAGDDSFPVPAAELRMGPIWVKRDIERYKKSFETTRRRRRTKAEVEAERAEKAQAKAAEVSPSTVGTSKAKSTKATNGKAPSKVAGKLTVKKTASTKPPARKLKLV